MKSIAQIFKALGDENRLNILLLISNKSFCARGVAKKLGISESSVSQHIKILKDAGLIIGTKVGYFVHYELLSTPFVETQNLLFLLSNTVDLNSTEYAKLLSYDCQKICKCSKRSCCQIKKGDDFNENLYSN